ncbi:MAG: winged helix-turn-helix domain-containing protein [Bacteroidales bacterium]|nr:winged helix-turn-helix domain-containing protein [Bacteroidales bacterium]
MHTKAFSRNIQKGEVYNLLKKFGFTCQKGKAQYPEADEQKRDESWVTIKKLKKEPHGIVIPSEDGFGLSNTATISYNWTPCGKQSKVICKQNRRERQR